VVFMAQEILGHHRNYGAREHIRCQHCKNHGLTERNEQISCDT
jgi:hypothetical protein